MAQAKNCPLAPILGISQIPSFRPAQLDLGHNFGHVLVTITLRPSRELFLVLILNEKMVEPRGVEPLTS